MQMLAIGAKGVADLDGQFARRRQDQGAHAFRPGRCLVLEQALQDWQAEGRRLAGARLGDAEQVAPGQQVRNRLGLDGSRLGIVFRRESAPDRFDEREVVKSIRHDKSFFLCWPSTDETVRWQDSRLAEAGRNSGVASNKTEIRVRRMVIGGQAFPSGPAGPRDMVLG